MNPSVTDNINTTTVFIYAKQHKDILLFYFRHLYQIIYIHWSMVSNNGLWSINLFWTSKNKSKYILCMYAWIYVLVLVFKHGRNVLHVSIK